MKKIIYVILIIFCSVHSLGQIWSKQIGGGWDDTGKGVCTSQGDYFLCGRFGGTNLINDLDTLTATIHGDLFISKISTNGIMQWLKQIKCFNSDTNCLAYFTDVVVDEARQVFYTTGFFCDYVNIDTLVLTAAGDYDILFAKFDFDGNCIWAKKMGGGGRDEPLGLTIDTSGCIYLGGRNSSIAYFDTNAISPGSFIAKYNTNGTVIWTKKISNYVGFNRGFWISKLKYIDNKLIVGGIINRDSASIDTITVSHLGYMSSVICNFDLSGNIQWLKIVKSKMEVSINDIAFDGQKNIYFAGYFKDTVDYNNQLLISSTGQTDIFLFKIDSLGNYVWHKQFFSHNYSRILNVCSNFNGELYFTGYIHDTLTLAGNILIPDMPEDLILAHFDSSGIYLGVIHYGEALGSQVSQDLNGKIYLLSHFINSINNGLSTYNTYGSYDILISKYDAINGIQNIERNSSNQLLIYANPNTGKCSIQIPDEFKNEQELSLKIYSNAGQLLQDKVIRLNSGIISVDLEDEAKGIYNVSLSNRTRKYVGKIVFE